MSSHRGRCHGRPPQVWSLTLICLVGAVLCLVGVVRPATPASPVALDAVFAAVGLLLGAALWSSGAVVRPLRLHAAGGFYVAATTTLVAEAATGEGAISTAVAYTWISMYAAVFFSRSTARSYALLSGIALALGLALNPNIVSGFASWLVVVSSLVAGVEMLAWLLERMRAMAVTDELTGLWNRAALGESLRREQAAAARDGGLLALAVIDLDGFKVVNDRDGHVAGDRLLVALAQEWKASIRPRDLLFRYGGDEFVLLLPDTSEGGAHAMLAALRSSSVASWSYGVGRVSPDDDLDTCLARADRLMYEQKAGAVARTLVRT